MKPLIAATNPPAIARQRAIISPAAPIIRPSQPNTTKQAPHTTSIASQVPKNEHQMLRPPYSTSIHWPDIEEFNGVRKQIATLILKR
jgi:hypothetical protein